MDICEFRWQNARVAPAPVDPIVLRRLGVKLSLACLTFAALTIVMASQPAFAGDVYDNGAINGTIDGWTFNFGYEQSDSFTVTGGNGAVGGFSFGAWLYPGDVLTSAELSITSNEGGGTTYFDQVLQFTQSNCFTNDFGFDVCEEKAIFAGPNLSNGTYWVNLQNAIVPSGDPVFWDENDGPASASNNSVGTMPSESFTVMGATQTTTPEPSSLVLFGSAIAGIAGVLRRRIF